MIEGPQRASFESNVSHNRSLRREPGVTTTANVGEIWPLGIIKTVSVEVIEEDAADFMQRNGGGGAAAAAGSKDPERANSERRSGQEDWDKYLR
jgi:hypothetical protein